MFRWFEHNQVFHPDRVLEKLPKGLSWSPTEIAFAAGDGTKLHGWFIAARTASPRSQYVVLYCHGNAGNISHRLDTYAALLATGVNILAFDYRGFGRSEGRPDEAGTYLDAVAAYEEARRRGFDPSHIIVMGESLGGGIASGLALRETIGGLILQSTFTSIPDIGVELFPWLPVRWLATIQYDTVKRLPKIHVPVLVMHSRKDGLIAFRHAERNFAAANEPKIFWEISGDHNEAVLDSRLFTAGLEKFMALMDSRPGSPAPGG